MAPAYSPVLRQIRGIDHRAYFKHCVSKGYTDSKLIHYFYKSLKIYLNNTTKFNAYIPEILQCSLCPYLREIPRLPIWIRPTRCFVGSKARLLAGVELFGKAPLNFVYEPRLGTKQPTPYIAYRGELRTKQGRTFYCCIGEDPMRLIVVT